tara:strand:- start:234 stop:497 length:264 start_codon:yes stop_codon:yes gene_type:complete
MTEYDYDKELDWAAYEVSSEALIATLSNEVSNKISCFAQNLFSQSGYATWSDNAQSAFVYSSIISGIEGEDLEDEEGYKEFYELEPK